MRKMHVSARYEMYWQSANTEFEWAAVLTRALRRVHGHEQVVKRLAKRRVGENCLLQGRVREITEHGDLRHVHQLAAFNPQAGVAEDLAGIGIDDCLYEPTAFIHLKRTRYVAHGHLGHADRVAPRAGF